jgi:hypothetical protein
MHKPHNHPFNNNIRQPGILLSKASHLHHISILANLMQRRLDHLALTVLSHQLLAFLSRLQGICHNALIPLPPIPISLHRYVQAV